MSRPWQAIPRLPRFVPLVPDPATDLPVMVGISLSGIIRKPNPQLAEAPRIAVLLGRDQDEEKIWDQLGSVGERLSSAGYVAAVAPGFSNWDEFSPADSLLNLARSAEAVKVLNSSIPTIPTIVGKTPEDARRWAEFLTDSAPAAIALHASTLRFDSGWNEFLGWVSTLQAEFVSQGYRPHLIVCGPSTLSRMVSMCRTWHGDLTFMSQLPYEVARAGRVLDELLSRRFSLLSHHDLVESNIILMSELVRQLLAPAS